MEHLFTKKQATVMGIYPIIVAIASLIVSFTYFGLGLLDGIKTTLFVISCTACLGLIYQITINLLFPKYPGKNLIAVKPVTRYAYKRWVTRALLWALCAFVFSVPLLLVKNDWLILVGIVFAVLLLWLDRDILADCPQ